MRKFALIVHITSSVGWLGAGVVFLALSVAGSIGPDVQVARAAYIAMGWACWAVLIPLAAASLVTGIVQSLVSPWGLFRHYWVLAKLSLTAVAAIVLLLYTETLDYLSRAAADPALTDLEFAGARSASPVLHSTAALLVLAINVGLSVYKPRGTTPYGQRKQHQTRSRVTPGGGHAARRKETA